MRLRGSAVDESPPFGNSLILKSTMGFLQTNDLDLWMSSKIQLQLLKLGQPTAIPRKDLQPLLCPNRQILGRCIWIHRVVHHSLAPTHSFLARLSPLDSSSQRSFLHSTHTYTRNPERADIEFPLLCPSSRRTRGRTVNPHAREPIGRSIILRCTFLSRNWDLAEHAPPRSGEKVNGRKDEHSNCRVDITILEDPLSGHVAGPENSCT